jgi:hypothetical protein
MRRDVIVHLQNEQPMLVDLLADPSPSDTSLGCTNLRTMSGQPPVFVERSDSTFMLPLAHVRFVEIRPEGVAAPALESRSRAAAPDTGKSAEAADAQASEERDSELIRRAREA